MFTALTRLWDRFVGLILGDRVEATPGKANSPRMVEPPVTFQPFVFDKAKAPPGLLEEATDHLLSSMGVPARLLKDPPPGVGNDELDRAVDTDKPVRVVDPDVPAAEGFTGTVRAASAAEVGADVDLHFEKGRLCPSDTAKAVDEVKQILADYLDKVGSSPAGDPPLRTAALTMTRRATAVAHQLLGLSAKDSAVALADLKDRDPVLYSLVLACFRDVRALAGGEANLVRLREETQRAKLREEMGQARAAGMPVTGPEGHHVPRYSHPAMEEFAAKVNTLIDQSRNGNKLPNVQGDWTPAERVDRVPVVDADVEGTLWGPSPLAGLRPPPEVKEDATQKVREKETPTTLQRAARVRQASEVAARTGLRPADLCRVLPEVRCK